jgi:hypothetical protein
VKHCENIRRPVHVVNLDPAAEYFDYPVDIGLLKIADRKTDRRADGRVGGPTGR